MLRKVLFAGVALFALVGGLCGAEYQGMLDRVNRPNLLLTFSLDGRTRTIKVGFDTVVLDEDDRKIDEGIYSPRLQENMPILLVTEGQGRDEKAVRIKIGR